MKEKALAVGWGILVVVLPLGALASLFLSLGMVYYAVLPDWAPSHYGDMPCGLVVLLMAVCWTGSIVMVRRWRRERFAINKVAAVLTALLLLIVFMAIQGVY